MARVLPHLAPLRDLVGSSLFRSRGGVDESDSEAEELEDSAIPAPIPHSDLFGTFSFKLPNLRAQARVLDSLGAAVSRLVQDDSSAPAALPRDAIGPFAAEGGLSLSPQHSPDDHSWHALLPSRHPSLRECQSRADVCAVCLDEFSPRRRICRLQCGHEFHGSCLLTWLQRSELCPLCKRSARPRPHGDERAAPAHERDRANFYVMSTILDHAGEHGASLSFVADWLSLILREDVVR